MLDLLPTLWFRNTWAWKEGVLTGGDHILFDEYFHGDNGAGLGASHQTGWTGVVARLLDLFGRVSAKDALLTSKEQVRE